MQIKKEKPLIGFFPCFYSIGETIPLIKIAKSYLDLGGRVIFFSHRGEYEYLAEQLDCKIVYLSDILEKLTKEGKLMFTENTAFIKNVKKIYNHDFVKNAIAEEIRAFHQTNIALCVSSFNLTTSISARAAHVPLVTVVSGAALPIYYKSGYGTFPDNFENIFTRFLPDSIKNFGVRWFILHNKMLVRPFNRISKQYDVPSYKYFNDLIIGDQTFVCDDLAFLGVRPSEAHPSNNFIGPIIGGNISEREKLNLDNDVTAFLNKPGKKIVLSMGSTGFKELFLQIVNTLNEKEYRVIAVYTNLLTAEKIPKTHENILWKKFVPLDKVLEQVDLAIIHGGRGTVYQVAYAGKPAICYPLLMEHEGNVGNLVRYKCGIRLSKKFFAPETLLKAIAEIFSDYEKYRHHAQILTESLQKQPGEVVAAQRLMEISANQTKLVFYNQRNHSSFSDVYR